jgi:hypothetical protein
MKLKQLVILGLVLLGYASLQAQTVNALECTVSENQTIVFSEVDFNYGSTTNAFNVNNKSSVTFGQPIVISSASSEFLMQDGYWARLQLPPFPPAIIASQGDLEDRIEVNWTPDPLSPASTSYKLYRDGSLLATVDGETFSFIDFNVVAGKFYDYEVAGVNAFGLGNRDAALGFLNPNGIITGQVQSMNGNPVPRATVTLSPTIGRAVSYNQTAHSFAKYNPAFPRDIFTLSCWVKIGSNNDKSAIFDMGSTIGKNWWLHTTPSASGKGVVFGMGRAIGDITEMTYVFPTATADDWHNIAITYNGASALLYVDGELVQTVVTTLNEAESDFFVGQKPDDSGRFNGLVDELRIFNQQLPQTDLQMFQNQSLNSATPGLAAYWKFDEGAGVKTFDISPNNLTLYHCGAQWATDKPAVVNAGITDEEGFYIIEGINYGSGTVFTVSPQKKFYYNQSLEFNAVNNDYVELTNFDIPDSATVEVTVKAFDFAGDQCILTKQNGSTTHFGVHLNAGSLVLEMGGQMHDFGPLGMDYYRLSFLIEQASGSSSANVTLYKNGELSGNHTFTGVSTDFSVGTPWTVGAGRQGATMERYFSGLVDEVAFSKGLTPLNVIQAAGNIGTDASRSELLHYFPFNEGSNTTVKDYGALLSGSGSISGAKFSTVVKVAKEEPHLFNPSSRLLTMNPNNTSADQVDFVDLSTIPVSGYVRFKGTSCFAKKAEILANGFPFSPPVFTDSEGKFTIDLEPGANVILTPKLENHTFYPGFWELSNLNAPVAGILFQDETKREVVGQLAGGYCRESIIPDGSIVKVKVATLNGCFEKVIQITNPDGKFTFTGVPPDSVTVALIEHSNPIIYNYFQLQGGVTLDLKIKNDTTDFIYFAPPNVELTALDTNLCGDPMLNMLQSANTTIRVYEDYDGGRCYVDTALLTIDNEIAGLYQFDTLMTEGSLVHRFKVDAPNIVPPYLKTLQITAEVHDELATDVLTAVVLGRRPRLTSFTSTAPELPTLILRDPPGDGSSAYMESGESSCQEWSMELADVNNYENKFTLHLGPDIETEVGTPFFATSLQVDVTADLGYSFGGSTTSYTSNSMETCLTTTKTISTSSDQYIVGSGMGGDVYMGGAMNFVFGITDELIFDTANCAFVLDKGLFVFPEGFATTFIYSERQIKEGVIPDLLLIGDTVSAQRWQGIIDYNTQLKKNAVFSKNISFDAGVVYEESETTALTESSTNSWTQTFSSSFIADFGVTVNGLGLSYGLNMSWTTESTESETFTTEKTRTVGYTLADDDIGDNFTINIKKDPVYGTPVFDLVSGQSQCPHEPKTQPREGVDMAADKQVAVNVPMNDVAVFKLTLGNTSQSEEVKFYTLEGLQENNPDGAVIRFNGLPSLNVGIPYGENVEVTMTVGRGPVAFDYQDLRIGFFSDCEAERSDFLGIDPPAGFNKELEFDVYFLEPCSPVNVSLPLGGWVLTPANGNILNITVAEYDKSDPDLELMRVQYRRTVGNGAWINITEIPKADLGNVFTIVPWNTNGLQDGLYDIRVITQCFNSALNPGISQVVTGRIERTPPELFGTPEPADGVLNQGDEISITFNEPIRCDLLIQADFFSNNNVGLYDAQTGELVDALMSCSGDKIVLVPNVPNSFIENRVLRVEVDSVKDMAGNKFGHAQWEFFVDRNPLRWQGGNIEAVIYEGEGLTLGRDLQNIGGQALSYTIEEVPDWVADIYPFEGSLSSASSQTVVFEFDENLPRGDYRDTIFAKGALGDEPMSIHLRKLCKGPLWEVNPAAWSYSMNFTLQLDIEGTLSADKIDRVGAFVNGQLRGWAYVQYEKDIDKYLAFLTVFSNTVGGETIEFQIWDADECLLYGEVVESFTFILDAFVGSPNTPQVLHTNNMLLRRIPLGPGWNWISFNLDAPNKNTSSVLSSLNNPQGSLIKNQTQFSQYSVPLSQWIGSLTNLGYKSMYQYQSAANDTIDLLGMRILPDTVSIPINTGWNWISYLPNDARTPDEALSTLVPLNNDIIKGRSTFAQYMAGIGWIGNLDYLSPPNGYMLKISNPGILVYPPDLLPQGPGFPNELPNQELTDRSTSSLWNVDPSLFEHSMNLIAVVGANENLLDEGDAVGAFVNGEVRGGSDAMWVEPLQSWLVFLTVYANLSAGEEVSFKYYDASAEDIHRLNEKLTFAVNEVNGSVEQPLVLTLEGATEATESLSGNWFEVYPNPARDAVFAAFTSPGEERVTVRISDSMGRLVREFEADAASGVNMVKWETAGVVPGHYLVSFYSESEVLTRRVTVMR